MGLIETYSDEWTSPIQDLDDLPSEAEVHPEDEPTVEKVSTTARVILFILLCYMCNTEIGERQIDKKCKEW